MPVVSDVGEAASCSSLAVADTGDAFWTFCVPDDAFPYNFFVREPGQKITRKKATANLRERQNI